MERRPCKQQPTTEDWDALVALRARLQQIKAQSSDLFAEKSVVEGEIENWFSKFTTNQTERKT